MGTRRSASAVVLAVVCLTLASLVSAQTMPAGPVGYEDPGPGQAVDTTTAMVYYYDDNRFESWVSIGQRHGLRPGAEVAFQRGGQEVARGTVVTVRDADAVIKPAEGTPGGAIRTGDMVQVVSNGSRAAADKALAQCRGRENALTTAIVLALTVLIQVAR